MTLTVGIDTYCTLAEADTYFASTFNNAEWVAMPDATQEIALKTACRKMEQLNYIGIKQDDNQPLQFPRSYNNSDYDGTPEDVKNAQCELALYLYQNQSNQVLNAQQMGLKSISLGNESYSFWEGSTSANAIMSSEANAYLDKWLKKGFTLC